VPRTVCVSTSTAVLPPVSFARCLAAALACTARYVLSRRGAVGLTFCLRFAATAALRSTFTRAISGEEGRGADAEVEVEVEVEVGGAFSFAGGAGAGF
jgi:hypothetical protein